jgi:hypothetical protein
MPAILPRMLRDAGDIAQDWRKAPGKAGEEGSIGMTVMHNGQLEFAGA